CSLIVVFRKTGNLAAYAELSLIANVLLNLTHIHVVSNVLSPANVVVQRDNSVLTADLRNLARPYQTYVDGVKLWSVEGETIGYTTNVISREHHLVNLFVEVSVGNESSYRNARVVLELHSKFKQV